MTGGAAGQGRGHAGTDGAGFGVHVAPDSLANAIDDTNTMDGDPVVYLHGAEDVVVDGYRLTAPSNPTNLGRIVLIGCRDVTVRNNEVAGFLGGGGATGAHRQPGEPGLDATGILVQDSWSVTVTGNTVSAVTGGRGGTAGYDARVAGSGGAGVGIRLVRCTAVSLSGNAVHRIRGGAAGTEAAGSVPGPPGPAAGILVIASENVRSTNDLVFAVSASAAARGFHLQGECPGARITNATVHGARGASDGTGIRVDAGAGVIVKNSIVVSCSHHGIWNHPDNAELDLRVSYSDVWGNPAANLVHVREGDDVISLDPLFVEDEPVAPADFALDDGSPAIDAGDDSECDNEPHDQAGDCRIDLGHLGNTAGARTNDPPPE